MIRETIVGARVKFRTDWSLRGVVKNWSLVPQGNGHPPQLIFIVAVDGKIGNEALETWLDIDTIPFAYNSTGEGV
jgi:hypothetical protein